MTKPASGTVVSAKNSQPSVEIIAELAQGFEGRPEQARLLLKAAASGGADAAKYQVVYADELATPDYKHYELFRSLEMDDAVWAELARYSQELGIKLYADVFGVRSLALAERIGIPVIKLHPTDVANVGFLQQIAASSISRVILGAGGAYASELEQALELLQRKDVVVLLGFQGYPTPNETNQIARVRLIGERIGVASGRLAIGFADHAPPDAPLRYALAATAVGAGATVVEKHLTLAKNMKLEDHEAALNPDEFAEFCEVVRACAAAVGSAEESEDFGMSDSELDYRRTIRRHVVTSRDVAAGTALSPADLVLKRASGGDLLTDLERVYGRTARRALPANSSITPADIN